MTASTEGPCHLLHRPMHVLCAAHGGLVFLQEKKQQAAAARAAAKAKAQQVRDRSWQPVRLLPCVFALCTTCVRCLACAVLSCKHHHVVWRQ
jgi:hypothetical protein